MLAQLGLELLGAPPVPADDEAAGARQGCRRRGPVVILELLQQFARCLDVVQIPEAVLQPRKALEVARRRVAFEEGAEAFGGVAQPLHAQTQAVPVLRRKLREAAATLADLAIALREQPAREDARGFAKLLRGFGLAHPRPTSALDQSADLQQPGRLARGR